MKSSNGWLVEAHHPDRIWWKRLGLFGFLFFLAKGLLWLSIPALLAVAGMN